MTSREAEMLRQAGEIAGKARDYGASLVKEGAKLLDVAERVEDFIINEGAELAFPVNLSVNSQAAHYTPTHDDERVFRRGDLVKVDVGAHVDGYIGDTAVTVEVGTARQRQLIEASSEALDAAISVIRPGVSVREVGQAVSAVISSFGFRPVRNLTGHQLKQYVLHAGLSIPSVDDGDNTILREGMAVAVEPFASTGSGVVDGRTSGNIFHAVRIRRGVAEIDPLVAAIEARKGLPFSERYLYKSDPDPENFQKHLRKLHRMGVIRPYPILSDTRGGLVSQKEHSLLITAEGCEVLTKV